MFHATLSGPVGPQATPPRHLHSPSCSASPSSPPRSCSATPCATGFDNAVRRGQRRHSTSSCAAPTEIGSGDSTSRGAIDASIGRRRSPPCPASRAAVADGRRRRARSLGADGEPHRRRRSADDRRQLGRRPRRSTRTDLAEGRAPAGAGRGRHRPRPAPQTATSTSATRPRSSRPTPVEVTVVGIATFGDVDSLGPTTYTAFTLPPGDASCSPSARTRSRRSSWPPTTASARRRCATRSPSSCRPRIEALTGAELTAEQKDEIGADFLDCSRDVPAGVRRHRPASSPRSASTTRSRSSSPSAPVSRRCCGRSAPPAARSSRPVAVEALVVGVVASAVGLGAGIGLAAGLEGPAWTAPASTCRSTGSSIRPARSSIAAVVGVARRRSSPASLPALKASRVAPLAALRDVAVDRSGASKVRAVVGVAASPVPASPSSSTATSSAPTARWPGPGSVRWLMLVGVVVLGPGRGPPGGRACSGAGAGVTRGSAGPPGPAQRDAQPAAHRRQRRRR